MSLSQISENIKKIEKTFNQFIDDIIFFFGIAKWIG